MVVTRYLTSQANKSIAFVILVLVALISLFELVDELADTNETYSAAQAIEYILMTTPSRLNEVIIYGVFMGYLIALGGMAESHQITVLRASGVSTVGLFRALSPSLLLWLAIGIGCAEFVVPPMEKAADSARGQAKYGATGAQGFWLKTDGRFVRVGSFLGVDRATAIEQYTVAEDHRLVDAMRADAARFEPATDGWVIEAGARTTLDGDESVPTTFETADWPLTLAPDLLELQAYLDPEKMSLEQLLSQIEFTRKERLSATRYELEFWQRIMRPLTFMSLTLLALAMVLGTPRNVGIGVRIVSGFFIGLVFKYLQDLFSPIAIVYGFPSWSAVLTPIAMSFAAAVMIVRRNT